MANFEDVGRAVDREIEKLRRFLEAEIKPTTERRLAEALRQASERLGELAQKLEKRQAGKSSAGDPALRD
jgi:cytidylate kinase